MGKPGYTYDDQKQQAESLSQGAPMVPTGNNSYYTGDAVVIYLLKQGVPLEQAESLASSLKRGGQDDLGIQGSAAAQVAERELMRMKTLSRYLDLEKRAGAGDQLDRRDQAFLAAVRARHQELIRDRAFQAEAEAKDHALARDQQRTEMQAAEQSKIGALRGQQLERVGQREQGRMANMSAAAQNPGNSVISSDGLHMAISDPAQATANPLVVPHTTAQLLQQKLFGQAKTAAAIAQQFGIPPDSAAQLATQLHAMPSPSPQPDTGGVPGRLGAMTGPTALIPGL